MNYIFKLTTRGLCSELNSLLGFYESIIDEECKVFIDGSTSQYFKEVSIYDVFDFPFNFVKEAPGEATMVSSNKWRKAACRNYKCSLSSQVCLDFFTLNRSFQDTIDSTVASLKLPDDYNCLFIRRGDKVGEALYRWTERTGRTESKRYEFHNYLQRVNNDTKVIFIFTDDYRSVTEAEEYIKVNKLNHKIITLTLKDDIGHSTDADLDNNKVHTNDDLIKFFAKIAVAKKSKEFIGTESSNIFRYIRSTITDKVELKSLD